MIYSVDSHVGKHIVDEVLSSRNGLLHSKTRVLVTNSLFVLPEVDYIVVIKNGKITDFGTYDDLLAQKGDFFELIDQYTTNNVTEDDSDSTHSSVEVRHRASTTEAPKTEKEDKSKLVEVERTETGNVKFAVSIERIKVLKYFQIIYNYMKRYTKNLRNLCLCFGHSV